MFRKITYWCLFLWAAFISYGTVSSLLHGSLFTPLSMVFSSSNVWLNKPFALAFQTAYFLAQPLLGLLAAIFLSWRIISLISTRNFSAQRLTGFSFVTVQILLLLVCVPIVFALLNFLIKSGAFWLGVSLVVLPWVYMLVPILATLSFVACEASARLIARKVIHAP